MKERNKKRHKLIKLKEQYYFYLDRKARHIASKMVRRQLSSKLLLKYIYELYETAKLDAFEKTGKFESAYHNPISSDLEFLIARVLFHYSNVKGYDWKILLRRQYRKTAPDIRIEASSGKTVAIVEIKAKAGWIQPFFSRERYKKDLKRLKDGDSNFNPKEMLKKLKGQLKKYYKVYRIKPRQVYVFLPSLALVHRKKSKENIRGYKQWFAKQSGLPKNNLILLSNNLNLDLGGKNKIAEFAETNSFERFVRSISR